MSVAQWIAVDWGTSNVRLWGMDSGNNPVFSAQSDRGMSRLDPEDYPDILAKLIGDRPVADGIVNIVICGMAGAKQGWQEATYLETPADLSRLGSNAVSPAVEDHPWRVHIVSGVCQREPEDVMRGEETQLLGLMGLKKGFSGTVCMPGTHAKWAFIEDGHLTRFATCMTGELYEILSTHSVLRHSLNGELTGPDTESGIEAGLSEGLHAPQLLTSALFRTRAASLLSGKGPDWCGGFVSGLLIGAEVAGHHDWLDRAKSVPLIGSARLSRIYSRALAMVGSNSETIDASAATLAGLIEAKKQIAHA